MNQRTGKYFSGAVLLLDELPKLDPNTAGVLNDGLSDFLSVVEKKIDEIKKVSWDTHLFKYIKFDFILLIEYLYSFEEKLLSTHF
jgi:hypothetical protein